MSSLVETIPTLGFGLMRLPQSQGKIDIEAAKEMIDTFMDAGLTYFDTARAYPGSEAAVREALVERYPRSAYQLATKNACWLDAKNADEARAMFQTSLDETGAGYFDFYLLHNLGDARTGVFDEYDMWTFLSELKAQGLVKNIGFSLHDTADVLDEILTAHPEVDFVQLQVNYADWENGSVQARACCECAKKHNKPIVIMEPVRGGTLAEPPAAVQEILRQANPEASFASWAMRFVLGLDNVITVLSGASTLEQLRENIETYRTLKPLNEAEYAAIERAQAALAEIASIPCTACHYCMKECPQDIDIANIMKALNCLDQHGLSDGKKWYGFAIRDRGSAADCIACGQCETACPQHIVVMDELDRAAEAFA